MDNCDFKGGGKYKEYNISMKDIDTRSIKYERSFML